MKKNKRIAMMGAIALTAAMSFSGCTSEEEVNNPNYNPETGEVMTSFVFNVSTSNTPTGLSMG